MLGHRGCRLGISFPEIYEMQCRAIFEALIECKHKKIRSTLPEIMIPLVSTEAEIKIMKEAGKIVAIAVRKAFDVMQPGITTKELDKQIKEVEKIKSELSKKDLERLEQNVPKQEVGRLSYKELTLSRANKSVRIFNFSNQY